ncbi:MAG: type II toxin-antitoxin system PemK/MazF family toxin [Candidatus Woesearchaeota archaeon]
MNAITVKPQGFEHKSVIYFKCDFRGRNTEYDGYKNGKGGLERPFLIISGTTYNAENNNDGIYALPITSAGEGHTFSHQIASDDLDYPEKGRSLIGSVILCDKICRVGHQDKWSEQTYGIKVRYNSMNTIKNKMNEFIKNTF